MKQAPDEAAPAGARLFAVPLHRVRRGRATALVTTQPEPPPAPRPPRVAYMLALAHELQGLVDAGEVQDRAEIARHLGFTRARVTQLLDLLLLAPEIQEAVLCSTSNVEAPAITERQLRMFARAESWAIQRHRWREVFGRPDARR